MGSRWPLILSKPPAVHKDMHASQHGFNLFLSTGQQLMPMEN